MHVFYAHDHTWTLVVDELTPPKLLQEAEEKDITVWNDPERVLKSIPLKAPGEESRYTQPRSKSEESASRARWIVRRNVIRLPFLARVVQFQV